MKSLIFILLASILIISCKSKTAESENSVPDTAISKTLNKQITTQPVVDTATQLFKGAWFDVKYPASFTAKPSLISATNKEAYESAFFTSPDGDVVFYVFSPQWNGKATDIALKAGEKIVSQDSSFNVAEKKKVRNWTIEASDKSYSRSYQEITLHENINWIIGIQYKNKAAYEKYKVQYLAFKNSLKQYAD